MAKKKKAKKAGKQGRIAQMRQVYSMTRQTDRWLGLILLGVLVGVTLAAFLVFTLLPPGWFWVDLISSLLFGLLAALIIFSRRATKAQMSQIKGKPGAALAALSVLRRGWRTDQMIAFNRHQDVVHRVVGRPGIILIGEGHPRRVQQLLSTERVRHQRVVSEVPVHEIVVGDGEGQVRLERLVKHVSKLDKALKPAELTEVLSRLKAIDATRSQMPLPKGPVPTSMKGLRGNMRGR
jgi:hypothetical protein